MHVLSGTDRSRRRPLSVAGSMSSGMSVGAWPDDCRLVHQACAFELYLYSSLDGKQCRWCSTGAIWSHRCFGLIITSEWSRQRHCTHIYTKLRLTMTLTVVVVVQESAGSPLNNISVGGSRWNIVDLATCFGCDQKDVSSYGNVSPVWHLSAESADASCVVGWTIVIHFCFGVSVGLLRAKRYSTTGH